MGRLLLVCWALGLLSACGPTCTLAFFFCDLTVDVTLAAGGSFPDGLYSLRMHDGTVDRTASCQVKDGSGGPSCTSGNPDFAPDWSVGVSGPKMTVTIQPSVGNIPSLLFELKRDGGLLKQGEVPLTHNVSEPNGHGCGECRLTHGDIVL